jgi:hypothetical protein
MSDQIATTPLSGPIEYDFGAQTPEDWPRLYVSKEAHAAEKLRWVRSLTQICSYCGWEAKAGGDSWGALQAHVRACPEHPVTKFRVALVAVCERGDTDHSAKAMYWIASDALKAAGYDSMGRPSQSDGGVK